MQRPKEGRKEHEFHRHFLLFESLGGSRYIFDAGTSTTHPWPASLSGEATEAIYSSSDEDLPATLSALGAPPELGRYVHSWRTHANCFREQIPAHACGACAAPPSGPSDNGHEHAAHQGDKVWKPSPAVMSNLMLVVTDDCNLRCRYCIFSGLYEGYKEYRRDRMSWDTARRAVDHFLALNDKRPFRALPHRKLDISFFGGEPMLEGDLIRRVVEYARARKKPHYDLFFSMTSNLTHLSDDLAEFLVSEGVGVLASLDGPQQDHDRYRRDVGDGGTFEKVRANLRKLRGLSQEYFDRHVRAVVTLTGNSDLLAIRDFFDSGDPDLPRLEYVGNIRDQTDGGFHQLYPADKERLGEQHNQLFLEYVDRKRRGAPVEPGSFLFEFFERGLKNLYQRIMFVGNRDHQWNTGTCEPGRRIAVSTKGQLHLCERINEEFPIGDVQRGLDFDRVTEVDERYHARKPDCGRCWARSLCSACYAQACDGEEFRFAYRMCDQIRTGRAEELIKLYTVLEAAPGGLSVGDPLIDPMGCLEVSS